jgi:hypothetical protein
MKTKFIELDAYLREIGVAREDLLADTGRPLISRIGESDYVLTEDARRFESEKKARALYARAGVELPPRTEWPDRPLNLGAA